MHDKFVSKCCERVEMRNKGEREKKRRRKLVGETDREKRGCGEGARENENLIFMKHFKVVPSEKWV